MLGKHIEEPAELVITTGEREEFGFPENPSLQQTQCWANQERVLAAIKKTGTMSLAAEAAGLTVYAVDRWVAIDLYGFKKRREAALRVYDDMLDAEIDRRAVEGVEKPIHYKGERVDTVREYSDNLLMFRRKQRDPSFRDNFTVNVDTKDIKVTSITFNLHPGIEPPPGFQNPQAPPPVPEPVREAEVRESVAGNEGT